MKVATRQILLSVTGVINRRHVNYVLHRPLGASRFTTQMGNLAAGLGLLSGIGVTHRRQENHEMHQRRFGFRLSLCVQRKHGILDEGYT